MTRFLNACIIVLILAGSVAASTPTAPLRGSQPIKIKSSELFTDTANRTATFVGKVTARQGDMTIHSDKLLIRYSEKDDAVETVEATGNVKVTQGDRQATAGRAIYDNKLGKIVFDISPKVYQGDNVVSGNVITYFVEEQRSVVSGGRVEAEIHPRGKGNNAGAKP